MFVARLVLLSSLLGVVYSWCTPFVACNQTVYGDFTDLDKNLKVVLLGRPFQKYDVISVTGRFYNNGSNISDSASFLVGMSKGLIMHQFQDAIPEDYFMTISVGVEDKMMNVTGYDSGAGYNEYGLKEVKRPVLSTDGLFTFQIKSVDGFGFAFGNDQTFTSKLIYQYQEPDRAQSVFFGGEFQTTQLELQCADYSSS